MDEQKPVALRPCPFCGHEPTLEFSSVNGPEYLVHCQAKDCPAWPNVSAPTEEVAIAVWNSRPQPAPDAGGLVERLLETRPRYDVNTGKHSHDVLYNRDGEEAAAALTDLQAKLEEVETALKDIQSFGYANPGYGHSCAKKAEATLARLGARDEP